MSTNTSDTKLESCDCFPKKLFISLKFIFFRRFFSSVENTAEKIDTDRCNNHYL
jgi:hypothetical protein